MSEERVKSHGALHGYRQSGCRACCYDEAWTTEERMKACIEFELERGGIPAGAIYALQRDLERGWFKANAGMSRLSAPSDGYPKSEQGD